MSDQRVRGLSQGTGGRGTLHGEQNQVGEGGDGGAAAEVGQAEAADLWK